jgi:hypothetical protein
LKTAESVFVAYIRLVSGTRSNFGSPLVWISSAGFVLTRTTGSCVGASSADLGSSRSTDGSPFSESLTRSSAAGLSATSAHGPCGDGAAAQRCIARK